MSLRHRLRRRLGALARAAVGMALVCMALVSALATAQASSLATLSSQTMVDYTSYPITNVDSVAPLVMLTLSRDHQLHYKAYNDYSDLDGDGVTETTYSHTFTYYGYFDSLKCYTYSTSSGRFEPASTQPTVVNDLPPYCNGQWSGNFLNWATMTRMDAVRKLLYGGLRSTDTSTMTVLERDFLPADGHAFAKYYNGSDISQLTPFSGLPTTPSTSITSAAISTTAYSVQTSSGILQPAGQSTVTVSTASAHGQVAGATVILSGTGVGDWDQVQTILTTPSATSFTFATSPSTTTRSTSSYTSTTATASTCKVNNTAISQNSQTTVTVSFTLPSNNSAPTTATKVTVENTQHFGFSSSKRGSWNGTWTIASVSQTGATVTYTYSVAGDSDASAGQQQSATALGTSAYPCTVTGTQTSSANAANGSIQQVVKIEASATDPLAYGDQIKLAIDASNYMYVVATNIVSSTGAAMSSGGSGSGAWYLKLTAPDAGNANRNVPIVSVTGSGFSTQTTATKLNNTGISLCNLTIGSGTNNNASQTNTNPPLLRVARGNFELWGANENRQCQWYGSDQLNGYSSNTQSGFDGGLRSNGNRASLSGLRASAESPVQTVHGLGSGSAVQGAAAAGQYIVRVQACVTGLIGGEHCKAYPNALLATPTASAKPTGLLQTYGDRIKFGLVTPSYTKNVSGGVVRKNLPLPGATPSLSDEVNVSTDGTFTGTAGIISNLDKLRIYGYRYDVGDNYGAGDGCTYQRTGIATSASGNVVAQGNCSSWGNPLSEAYMETIRYLAGLSPDGNFTYPSSGSKDASLGLTLVSSWTNPIDASNYCASLNVIAFNASVSSYDADQTTGFAGLTGSPNATTLTNTVGSNEGIDGGSYFVGASGGTSDGVCTAKTVGSLGGVKGICPEAASLEGSYLIAGAAYRAHTAHIRADIDVPSQDTQSLKVDTYGVALATNTPKIPVRSRSTGEVVATILPVYRLDLGANGVGGGAIVDFRIVEQNVAAGTGKFYVNWEDSSQGGDYDQDMWGTITYQLSSDNRSLTITTDAVSASTNNGQGLGYILSGTNKDGAHFHSGIYNFSYTDPTSITVVNASTGSSANATSFSSGGGINASGGCSSCKLLDPPTSATYSISSTSARSLQDPLFYAAKYGSFTDNDGDGLPTRASSDEWDTKNADGADGADGQPDNFFLVSNPSYLESALSKALADILAKTASGSAASVVANSRQGEGATFQALYEPRRDDSAGRQVRWIGTLQALFVDEAGNLREDGNGNARLDDFAADPAVSMFYDSGTKQTRFYRYGGDPADASSTVIAHDLPDLRTLWNARDRLSSASLITDVQRLYASTASSGRYIFTYVDKDLDGAVDTGEQLPFTTDTFAAGLYGSLNTASVTDASKIVGWVRGTEQDGLRNRTINYDGNGNRIMRLGDIVQSSPASVGTPAEAFDLLYSDQTYGAFREQYRNRRTMVYVGANDGMLHAFNGGVYDPSTKSFTASGHPLGSEMWAYVPYNLLPHLTWLTNSDYSHVWYVDGKPRIFDARIFAADADHPHGWGTVLVVGMRFGGGTLNTPITDTAAYSGFQLNGATSLTFRSSYIVLDVTNPEHAPALIAEISDPALAFTTSYPTSIAVAQTGNSSSSGAAGNWYLVFGSGPTSITDATSSQSARLYVYRLNNGSRGLVPGFDPYDLGVASSFVGDPVTTDFDLDFKADAVYFGTAGGTVAAPTGKLFKLPVGEVAAGTAWKPAIELLSGIARPMLTTPSVALDNAGNRWVLGGTGRFFSTGDKGSMASQVLFGVMDRSASATFGGLLDVSNARVATNSTVAGLTGITSFSSLETSAVTAGGWKRILSVPGAAERNLTQTSLLDDILFATTYTPDTSACTGEGASNLYGLYYRTGTPRPNSPIFGTSTANFSGVGVVDEAIASVSAGSGLAAAPSLFLPGSVQDDRGLTIFTQASTGMISAAQGSTTSKVRSGEIDWREDGQ